MLGPILAHSLSTIWQAKTIEGTVDLLIQTHKAKGALKFTKSHLKKIHRNDLVEKLDTGAGSKGPGPAKRKTAKKKSQEVKPRISKKNSELLKQIYPGLSLGAGGHSKILEEMWSKVSQSDKQPYEKIAQELREKYDTDMVTYRKMSQGGDEDADEDGDDEDYFGGSQPEEFGNPWSKQGPKTSDLFFQLISLIVRYPL